MRLERREMSLLALAAICLMALVYYFFVVSPALSRDKSLIGHIEKKESDLLKMKALKEEWDGFTQSRSKAETVLTRRGKRFTLLSFLEGVTRQVGIHEHIEYMKPISFPEEAGSVKREGIEMRINGMNTKQLVDFLYKIEFSAKLLHIKQIKIKRKAKEESLTVSLQIHTYVAA
jgi:hypothetical protein